MYTRYADDLTFSSNKHQFPESVAKLIANEAGEPKWVLSNELIKRIESTGFSINDSKTRMQLQSERQVVTGLVVNSHPNIEARKYRLLRAMIHCQKKTGACKFNNEICSINKLEGLVWFMFKIKEGNSKILLIDLDKTKLNKKNKICNEQPSHKQLLLDLLFHKHLFNNREPTIVTEGKTDYVYLKLAIHALHSKIDLNGLIDSATKKLKFSFLKHEKAGTEAILGSGGTGHLTKLIHYIRRMESR